MTKDEALRHLRNVLAEKNPNLARLVHDTEQRVLGEAAKRNRVYDGSIAGGLARTFVSLIRDRMKNALEETRRIFSMPGMPIEDSTKAGVKTILSDLQNQLLELAQGSLDRLAEGHSMNPKATALAPEIESMATAWPSEIDLLFVEAKQRAAAERRSRNAAIVSIIGAAATWTGVIVQWYHPKATTTSASPTPAVATPSLTPTPSATPSTPAQASVE
jgi:hypothetical protein